MDEMDGCHGQFGWREFHRNRKDILDEFDKIAEQTKNRPVRTAHGTGVEAYIRRWLSEFLPKKFGVTSGYIIPDIYHGSDKLYHYDIIIYDTLNSPVLWTEGNEDSSPQGRFRAIPAKHVVALYEVKARLNKKNVHDSLEKLGQTTQFASQLHRNYSCGAIFVELMEVDENKSSILLELSGGKDIIGFVGGVVLRYEKDHTITGTITRLRADPASRDEYKHHTPLAKPMQEVDLTMMEDGSIQMGGGGVGARFTVTAENTWSVTKTYGVILEDEGSWLHLSWSRSNFSEFCINLISSLEGLPINDERRPSFGQVFDSIARKPAEEQSQNAEPGKPHLNVSLYVGGEGEKTLELSLDGNPPTIDFWVEVENIGDGVATISDDGFKTSCELHEGMKAVKSVKVAISPMGVQEGVIDRIQAEGFEFPYRLVYRHQTEEKSFFSVEKSVVVRKGEIYFSA